MVIEWTGTSLEDLAALDKSAARRISQAIERFARAGVAT